MDDGKYEQIFLVKKAKNGDAEAFIALCEKYQVVLYNTAYKILLNDSDVADCLQETETRAWQKISNLKNEAAFNSWLFQIMVNIAKDSLKNRSKDAVFDETIYNASSLKNEEEINLNELLSHLPDNYRLPIILFYYSGFSVKEIAKQLQISKNAVKIRLSRGRQQLKKLVEEANNERR